jgi:4-carboxymuconolactone decarboxylase
MAMITGRCWGAQYEYWAHSQLTRTVGLPEATIDAITARRRPATMTEDQRIVHHFCTELFRDNAVSDATFAVAAGRFGEQGVIELIAASGYYSSLAAYGGNGWSVLRQRSPCVDPVPVTHQTKSTRSQETLDHAAQFVAQ